MIISLGTLGGLHSVGLGLNDCAQVVGGSDLPGGTRRAFLWDRGEMMHLGTVPGFPLSEARDINNEGHVVGASFLSFGSTSSEGFLWQQDQGLLPLGDLGAGRSDALGINEAGQIVGASAPNDPLTTHAYIWDDGEMTDLVATYGKASAVAWDVNDNAQIVGRLALWQSDGTVVDLPGEGVAINNQAEVVGWWQTDPPTPLDPPGPRQPFLWRDGEFTDLGPLGPCALGWARGINDSGQVTGLCHFPSATQQRGAFLYEAGTGTMHNLLGLLAPGHGWNDLVANDINEAGQIVGQGFVRGARGERAFLMTPLTGDFDNDGDSDLTDFSGFRPCLRGAAERVSGECDPYDIDSSGKIDLRDFQMLQWVFGSP